MSDLDLIARRWPLAAYVGLIVAALVAGVPSTAEGAETVRCGGAIVTIVGTPGNDVLEGTPGPDVIHGRAGNDVIGGLGGDDIICGGTGRDFLQGGPGDDTLFGGPSSDVLRGSLGYDVLRGGGGADAIRGGGDDDLIFGHSGPDAIQGGMGADVCFGGGGKDRQRSCNEPATASSSELRAGESLLAGQSITSPSGSYRLQIRQDGNVTLAHVATEGLILWDSDTTGHPGARLSMLASGNLVISYRGAAVWDSGTESAGASAKIRNNANLVVFSAVGDPLWDRRINPGIPDWQLPWSVGESWKAGAPHGTNNGSLDFGPAGGGGDVAAIASGTVGWFQCDNGGRYLQIEHGAGWMSTYYHLGQIRTELIGEWVEAGTIVGAAAQAVPCGGRSTFAHVHLVIWRDEVRQTADGLSIGGFTVHAGSQPYWGYWTDDASGETVVVNEDGAACCLANNPTG